VSPLGELRCRIGYEPVPNTPAARWCNGGYDFCPILLSGTLAAAGSGVTGHGSFVLGVPPLTIGWGVWTAVK
jgi:hypothetical protein